MSDQQRAKKSAESQGESQGSEKANLALQKSLPTNLPIETLEVLRDQQTVDVNRVLVFITERATPTEDVIAHAERLLELTAKIEKQRAENRERSLNALLDAKERDPDERDKRANNEIRRSLKRTISGVCVLSLLGGISLAAVGGSLLVSVILLSVTGLSMGLLGMLASGESVSSNDVVKVISAIRSAVSPSPEPNGPARQRRRKP